MPTITLPRGRKPKDPELWVWAFTNFGAANSGMLGVAVSKYNKHYFEKYGTTKGWDKR